MFRIGADPEVFLIDGNKKYISGIGLIGGSKEAPLVVGNGFAIQEDNVAAEFNIPPSQSARAFVANINKGLGFLEQRAKAAGLKLAFTPSVVFDEDQLQTDASRVFGCEPDLNAWTKKYNPRPKAKDPNLRSAGGHVHIESPSDPWELGRWCDIMLGIPMVLIDDDTRRRELYGKAGAIRIKNYPGIEYRTLSNRWLETDALKSWVFYNACEAAVAASKGEKIVGGPQIRKCINTSDKEMAKKIIEKYQVTMP